MNTFEGPNLENDKEHLPTRFIWRDYVQHPMILSEENRIKLDSMEEIINQRAAEGREFLAALHAGEFRKPALSFVQFFRDVLEPSERTQLLEEMRRSNPLGWL